MHIAIYAIRASYSILTYVYTSGLCTELFRLSCFGPQPALRIRVKVYIILVENAVRWRSLTRHTAEGDLHPQWICKPRECSPCRTAVCSRREAVTATCTEDEDRKSNPENERDRAKKEGKGG